MNTKGNNLDDVSERLVDAILAEPILQKATLLEKVRAIIQAWIRVNDRPANYDDIKTEKGTLQRTIEHRGVEKEFWRKKLIEKIGSDNMKPYYGELQELLKSNGFINQQKLK